MTSSTEFEPLESPVECILDDASIQLPVPPFDLGCTGHGDAAAIGERGRRSQHMSEVEVHPRYLEGVLRHSILRISRANAVGQDAIDHIDETLATLRGMKRNAGPACTTVSLNPVISILIREYEDIRARLTPLSSGLVPRAHEMDLLRHRMDLIEDLLTCIGDEDIFVVPSNKLF